MKYSSLDKLYKIKDLKMEVKCEDAGVYIKIRTGHQGRASRYINHERLILTILEHYFGTIPIMHKRT